MKAAKNVCLSLLVVALALVLCDAALAQGHHPNRNPQPSEEKTTPQGTGTIAYDPGTPADFTLGGGGPSQSIGNRFNTRNGSPLSTGSVSAVSFYLQNNTLGGGLVALWGPPTGGGGAPYIAGFTLGTVTNSTFDGISIAPVPVGNDFMAVMYLNSGQPSRGVLGLRSASTNAQGFHGMQMSFGGGAGANYAVLSNANAMLRATGTVVVPVELLEFELDAD